MIGRATQRRSFLWAGLALAGWAGLLGWAASPWGRYLDHGGWGRPGLAGAICGATGSALAYAGGWMLMLAAMMLPLALPVLAALERMTAARPDGGRLVAAAATGYLAAWGGFGLAAHAVDAGLGAAARRSAWLAFNGWAVAALVLAAAGAFQFTALKRRCLERCRSPLGQVAAHWRGMRPGREAWTIGWRHGLWCVACCWALMLAMFAVGAGNLGWMLALGLAMAAERNLPGGRTIGHAAGAALLVAAAAVLVLNLQPAAG